MILTPVHEFNPNHEPAGSPVGGQFARGHADVGTLIDREGFLHDRAGEIARRMPGDVKQNRAVVSQYIRRWTENSVSPETAALQRHAAEEFGLADAATEHLTRYEPVPSDVSRAQDRAFLRAMYENTQQWFRDHGITQVTVYRGMMTGLPAGNGQMTVRMQPMSSWSAVRSIADQFAKVSPQLPAAGVMALRVPVSRVLSTAVSGMGSAAEAEVVLLGGSYQVTVRPGPGF